MLLQPTTHGPRPDCRHALAGLTVTLLFLSGSPPAAGGSADAKTPAGHRAYDNAHHDVGVFDVRTTNLGQFGGSLIPGELNAAWQGDEYLSVASIWIGANKNGTRSVSTGAFELELLPPMDPDWHVYSSFEGFPGGNRIGLSPMPDDDDDGVVDEDFHNGLDDDTDGVIDEDFAAVSDQMFSAQYADTSEQSQALYPDHRPLDVLIQERSYAWAGSGLENVIVFDYRIRNVGGTTLHDVFVGLYVDADLGPPDEPAYWTDDGVGYLAKDTTLVDTSLDGCQLSNVSLRMPYAFDFPDAGAGSAGDVPGFAGLLLLDHTTDPLGVAAPADVDVRTCRVLEAPMPYPQGDPSNDLERDDLMQGTTVPVRATLFPGDYRFYLGVGPFVSLPPGDDVTLTVAYIVGEGYVDPVTGSPRPDLGTDGTPSDNSLLAVALRAYEAHAGVWVDADDNPETGANGEETCIAGPLAPFFWDDPCDPGPPILIEAETCDDPDGWVDMDCDACTPNPFQDTCTSGGCETLVRWYRSDLPTPIDFSTTTAPPASRVPLWSRPNPFSASTTIRYHVRETGLVRLSVFDVEGRLVARLVDAVREAGGNVIGWDGRNDSGSRVAPGSYYARLETGGTTRTWKLVLTE